MVRFDDLMAFARSAHLGSFSRAAREFGQPAGQVSAAIKRLERELGVRLFARSTRSLRLTEDGERYLPYAAKTLESLREGREALHADEERLSGVLRLSMPSDIGRNLLSACLSAFRRNHPDVALRVVLSDELSDVFRDPVDVAIRYGRLSDGSFLALPLARHNRRVLVASPDYLDRRGRPESLEALDRHDCLVFMAGGSLHDSWIFEAEGVRKTFSVQGAMIANDSDLVRRWTIDGLGISYKCWLDVYDDVTSGRLERVLPGLTGELYPLSMICPHREQLSPAIRKLREMMIAHLSEADQMIGPA